MAYIAQNRRVKHHLVIEDRFRPGILGSETMGIQNWFHSRETERIGHLEKLEFQRIKSVEFNSSGDLLLLGSRENDIVFWDWQAKTKRLSYDSGHSRSVDRIKILPLSDDKRIVTATNSGQVRLGEVSEDGQVRTRSLGSETYQYCTPCTCLAVEPGNPHVFYSSSGDGIVRQFDLRSNRAISLLHSSRLARGRYSMDEMSLHDITINPRNPNYFCTGGADVFARVYDIRKLQQQKYASCYRDEPVDKFCPYDLIDMPYTYITGLAYSNSSELLVSYYDDLTYLFQKDMGFGCLSTRCIALRQPQAFFGHRNDEYPRGLSFLGPDDDYVISGSSCHNIFIWKKTNGAPLRVIQSYVHQIKPHPHLPMIAACTLLENIDLYAPNADDHEKPLPHNIAEIMAFNEGLRRTNRHLKLVRSRMLEGLP